MGSCTYPVAKPVINLRWLPPMVHLYIHPRRSVIHLRKLSHPESRKHRATRDCGRIWVLTIHHRGTTLSARLPTSALVSRRALKAGQSLILAMGTSGHPSSKGSSTWVVVCQLNCSARAAALQNTSGQKVSKALEALHVMSVLRMYHLSHPQLQNLGHIVTHEHQKDASGQQMHSFRA